MSATGPYQIVVGVDQSEYTDIVLQHAFDQAARHERVLLHLVTVVPNESGLWHRPSDDELASHETDARQGLAARARQALQAVPDALWPIRLHVRRGRPETELVELAAETWADLIVVGRFGHSAPSRRLLGGRIGSVADRLIQSAECPVLVVGPPRDGTASNKQCPDCVRIRAETAGEDWFCPQHHTDRLPGLSILIGGPTYTRGSEGSSGGGSMW